MSPHRSATARARHRWLGVLVVLALVVAGCSNSGGGDDNASAAGSGTTAKDATSASNVPGVTDDEIRFAVFGTRSNNPTGACVLDCFTDGIKAYFAFRNSEGGVDGRKLTVTEVLDDALAQNKERALEIVSTNDTFAAFSATQLATGWHDITKAGMPLYVWGIHSAEMNGQDAIFASNGVICGTCTSRSTPYAGTLVDATKVGVLAYGATQASKDCGKATAASVKKYSAQTGQEVGYENVDLAFGLSNGVAPEVTAMKQAGVDFVTGCLDLNGMKTVAQELARQGMGDVPMLHPNTYDQNFVAEAGDLFEGDLVQVGFRPFEANPGDSGLDDFMTWMKKAGAEVTEPAMVGWIDADLAYQGLKAAGSDFDRAKVIAATNKMTDYDAHGLIVPIDWSRQHQAPTEADPGTHGYAKECWTYVQVHDGKFSVVGDAAKPWSCWDGTNRDWGKPEATDFG